MRKYFYFFMFLVALELVIAAFALNLVAIDLTVLFFLPFASSMGARAVSYLGIFEWLRAPFTRVVKHSSGAGEDVHPKDGDFNYVLGGLLSCINCSGMWVTVALLGLYILEPPIGSLTIYALGATGIGVLVTRSIELTEWKAHEAHENTGHMNRLNKAFTQPSGFMHRSPDGRAELSDPRELTKMEV